MSTDLTTAPPPRPPATPPRFCAPETCRHVQRTRGGGETKSSTLPSVIYVETGPAWTFGLDRPTGAARALSHRTPVFGSVIRRAGSPPEVHVTSAHAALGYAPAPVARTIAEAAAADAMSALSGSFSAQLELFDDGEGPKTVTLELHAALDSSGLSRLALEAPPMLSRAVGYDGPSRFVALFWDHEADAITHTDGRDTAHGDWINWLAFSEHPHVAPHLASLDIGNRGSDASDWLLIDRRSASFYAGPAEEVRRFVVAAAALQSPPPRADELPHATTTSTDEPVTTGIALRAWLDDSQKNDEAERAGQSIEGVVLRSAYLAADRLKPHRQETAGCLAVIGPDSVRLVDFELRCPDAGHLYHGHNGSAVRLTGMLSTEPRPGRRGLFVATRFERLDRELSREDVFLLEAISDTADRGESDLPRAPVTPRTPSEDDIELLRRTYDFQPTEGHGYLYAGGDCLAALGLHDLIKPETAQDDGTYALEQDAEAPRFVNALAARLGMTRREVWRQLIVVRELVHC